VTSRGTTTGQAIMSPVVTPTSRVLVGRDAELAELCSLLGVRSAGAATGTGTADGGRTTSSVLLGGDAGVGKTRLLTELRDVAFTEGWQVVAGHCLDFGDSALPYLPFTEILGRLAADHPDLVAEVSTAHPALARLQPGRRVLSGEAAGEHAGSLDRTELFEALHALLTAVARTGPLLVVVEDAHWADQSTRDMLSFLFSRPVVTPGAPASRAGLVVSYRADDLHRRHPLRRQVAEWARLRDVARVQLSPLPETAVRALVAELAPELAEDQLRAVTADIVARAEGNAFFVEELVAAASSGTAVDLPVDLADVLLVRLDRLDDTARQVVRAASAAGRRVGHDMLRATAGLDDAALDAGLRGAVDLNVLIADRGAYAFRPASRGAQNACLRGRSAQRAR
jgi:predicted ATPase